MPQKVWSRRRERQYKHIKQSLKRRGRSEDTAEEIAARTVNSRSRMTKAQLLRAVNRRSGRRAR